MRSLYLMTLAQKVASFLESSPNDCIAMLKLDGFASGWLMTPAEGVRVRVPEGDPTMDLTAEMDLLIAPARHRVGRPA